MNLELDLILTLIGVGVATIGSTLGALKWVYGRLDKKFEIIDRRFGTMEEKFDKRFEVMEEKFEVMEEKFDKKFEVMEEKFDRKFEVMEHKMDSRFEMVMTELKEMRKDIHSLDTRISRIEGCLEMYPYRQIKKAIGEE